MNATDKDTDVTVPTKLESIDTAKLENVTGGADWAGGGGSQAWGAWNGAKAGAGAGSNWWG